MTTTAKHPSCKSDISAEEASRLANFLAEHFPEEAASVDLSDPNSLTEVTLELLQRLWRLEK